MENQHPGITREDSATHIEVNYANRFTMFENGAPKTVVQNKVLKTSKVVPKLGVMLVGLGGNNGSTFVAGLIANRKKLTWETRQGPQTANFFGSFTQSATTHAGFRQNEDNGQFEDVFLPIKELVPMVAPVDFDVSGWDISSLNLYESCKRSRVLEPTLIQQLKEDLE